MPYILKLKKRKGANTMNFKKNNPITKLKLKCSNCKKKSTLFFRGKSYCSNCNPKKVIQMKGGKN